MAEHRAKSATVANATGASNTAATPESNVEPVDPTNLPAVWQAFLGVIAGGGPMLHSLLSQGQLVGIEDGRAVLCSAPSTKPSSEAGRKTAKKTSSAMRSARSSTKASASNSKSTPPPKFPLQRRANPNPPPFEPPRSASSIEAPAPPRSARNQNHAGVGRLDPRSRAAGKGVDGPAGGADYEGGVSGRTSRVGANLVFALVPREAGRTQGSPLRPRFAGSPFEGL